MSIRDIFRPKYKHSNSTVRLTAVERVVTNQEVLASIAKTDDNLQVRRVAIDKLSDQRLLAEVAWDAKESGTREDAVRKLTDSAVLVRIVKSDKSVDVRLAAAKKLSDHLVLAEIARTDGSPTIRRSVVQKIEDQAVLTDVAKKDDDWSVRFYAAEKLVDQVLAQHIFAEIAKASKEHRKAAIAKLSDQIILANFAKDDEDDSVRLEAVKNLKTETVLAEIAATDNNEEVRLAAVAKVTDQALLTKIVRTPPTAPDTSSNFDTRLAAMRKLYDVNFLAEILGKPSESNLYWSSLLFDDEKIKEAANRRIRLLRNVRSDTVTACLKWECIDCEELLDKGELEVTYRQGDPTSIISEEIKCPHCYASYQKADVYGGCYDVNADKINVLVFCLRAFQSPSDTESYCRYALGKKYQQSEIKLRTVAGWRGDYLSDYEAISAYRSYVRNGQIKDYGRLYDRFKATGSDGRNLYVLVFV